MILTYLKNELKYKWFFLNNVLEVLNVDTYKFPGMPVMSEQFDGVLNDSSVRRVRITILTLLAGQEKSVGDTFNVVILARNRFCEDRPHMKEWINGFMPRWIEAITPNDEDFRSRLLRSWDDAIND